MNAGMASVLSRMPSGLLGMLLLVVVAERFVVRNELHFSTALAFNWRTAEESARRARPDRELLAFGSSLTTHAFLPAVIEGKTGTRARNMATCGGTMVATYYLVKHALDSGAHPGRIILDCADNAVAEDRQSAVDDLHAKIRLWPEVLTLADAAELAWTARDADFLASLVVMRAFPSARARFELRANIRGALAGEWSSSLAGIFVARRNWRVNQGANVIATTAGQSFDPVAVPAAYPGIRWSTSRLCTTYARRLLELAASRGIPVVWVMPPVGPRITAWREANGLAAHATAFARQMKAEFPTITLVDGRRSGYPELAFCDGLHLNRDGAVAFSSALATILTERPAASPAPADWLVLAPYREGRTDASIESIEQSRAIVLQNRPSVRR